MSDETWDSHDRDTGNFCSRCGGDFGGCVDCTAKDERDRLSALVEALPGMHDDAMDSGYQICKRAVLELFRRGAS